MTNYQDVRLFDFLAQGLNEFPKDDMLCGKEGDTWKSLSTQQVADLVNKLSAGLLRLGLGKGDKTLEEQLKVSVISRNRPEWLILDLACQQIGVPLCPIYPTTNEAEIQFIFNDAAVQYVFVSGEDILHKIEAVKPYVGTLTEIISFDAMENVRFWESLWENVTDAEIQKVEELKKTIRALDCATIIYTSGTTGTPKGVMLSHTNIASNVINSCISFPFERNIEGKALSFLPLNHIFERMVTYIYLNCGVSVYYAQSLETLGEDMKEVKPTIFATVPRLLEKVYEKIEAKGAELKGTKRKLFNWAVRLANEYDNRNHGSLFYRLQLSIANKLVFSKWREALGNNVEMIISGGAACQVRLIRIFTAAGIPIYEGYGPTENSPVISVNLQREDGTKFGTVGPVINGQEVKIEPDGEICVKGPSVMMGYYKRPDLTAEAIIDGWLHTGDIGVFENDKFLKITDRKKELFKTSGGKYVAPQVIENKMKESPFIEQIMVVGAEQKFVGALVVPSFLKLKEWATENHVDYKTEKELISSPKVLQLFKEIVEKYNAGFNHVEQVKRIELLPEEWSIDSGEMTPKLSLKRKVIMEKYQDAIGRIYGK